MGSASWPTCVAKGCRRPVGRAQPSPSRTDLRLDRSPRSCGGDRRNEPTSSAYLRQLRVADSAIAAATELAEDVLVMLRRREGERLPAWVDAAEMSGMDDFARFARRLRTDLAAVQAGLTLRWSNGQTEGRVNRLKLLKRQGYGRAKVDLLRKRVLLAA